MIELAIETVGFVESRLSSEDLGVSCVSGWGAIPCLKIFKKFGKVVEIALLCKFAPCSENYMKIFKFRGENVEKMKKYNK